MKRIALWALICMLALCLGCGKGTAEAPELIVELTPSPTLSPTPTPTPAPTPSPTPYMGAFGASWPDKFSEEPLEGEDFFSNERVCVKLVTGRYVDANYFMADIYLKDLDNFKVTLAGDEYKENSTEWIYDAAERAGAVVSINGSYYSVQKESGTHSAGLLVVDGKVYREQLSTHADTLILKRNGEMKGYLVGEATVEEVLLEDVLYSWSFGPVLVRDGMATEDWNSDNKIYGLQPRSAIGYFQPGHYCFVAVDGRMGSRSRGLTMADTAALMQSLGCTLAYNLDGGQSSMLVLKGKLVNTPWKDGRAVSDYIHIIP